MSEWLLSIDYTDVRIWIAYPGLWLPHWTTFAGLL